jgi:universal stress protein A
MASYQHILAAIDLSAENDLIIDKAIELTTQNEAKLSLLYVVRPVGLFHSEEILLPAEFDLEEQLVAQAQKRLESLRSNHALGEAETLVKMGTAKQEIVRVAKEKGVDLIVIGSHGKHGLQLVLGSTANGVLHAADCDVLAVRVGSCEAG